MTEARRELNSKPRHHPSHIWFLGFIRLPFSPREWPPLIRFQSPPLKVWRGHRRGLFVEGVAVDTDGGEAALEPEARVNEPPAAESAAMERMRLNQAEQTRDLRHTFL